MQDTAALLLNAIYFKGGWASPFNPEQTGIRSFQLETSGNKNFYVETDFMFQDGKFQIGKGIFFIIFSFFSIFFYPSG
jgi:serine protease inhibitor